MKLTKKLLTAFVAILMVFPLSITAFAEGETQPQTHKISINGGKEGNTYEAYQVFSGKYVKDDKGNAQLVNIEWGTGVTGADTIVSELKAIKIKVGEETKKPFANVTSASDVAAVLGSELGQTFDSELAQKFADVVGQHLESTSGTFANNEITGLEDGYYLVQTDELKQKDEKDKNIAAAKTRYLLTVVGDNATLNVKESFPTVEKKVIDVNDSKETAAPAYEINDTKWQDSADYDIGDKVPYKLTGTLPSTYADYDTYKYTFVDTLSEGLTYNNDAKVYLVHGTDETEVTGKFTISGGQTLTVSIDNLKDVTKDENDKIVVLYSCTLNAKAKVALKANDEGNPNTVYLEFSNNPNQGGEGETGKTPEDKVIVFTYTLDVNKVDQDKKPLPDAGFTLFKKINGNEDLDAAFNDFPNKDQYKGYVKVTGDNALKVDEKDNTKFHATGLDDGEYMIVETTVPSGYNRANPVAFTISADHEATADDPKLTTLTRTSEGTVTVENKKGAVLPSTGGVGTTMFYVFGGVLVVCAGVLLVVRRRMSE